jgi:hypothetical protein
MMPIKKLNLSLEMIFLSNYLYPGDLTKTFSKTYSLVRKKLS